MLAGKFPRAHLGLAVILALACGVSASVIRHDRDQSAYLALGADPAFDCVGMLRFNVGATGYLGSGTLIAPRWVLTAGHCVDMTTSLTFTIGGKTYVGERWFAHTDWKGNLLTGYDVGLIELSEAVANISPAIRYAGSSEVGMVGTMVGFGRTGTGLTGATTYDGLKRAGQNMLDRTGFSGREVLCDFDNLLNPGDNVYGSAVPLDLECLIAPGDSGGAVFVDAGQGPRLAGVHSYGMSRDGRTDSDYGDASGHTRVSTFNTWINSVIYGQALAGLALKGNLTGLVPANLTAPEPATLGVLVVGAAVLPLKSRRRVM